MDHTQYRNRWHRLDALPGELVRLAERLPKVVHAFFPAKELDWWLYVPSRSETIDKVAALSIAARDGGRLLVGTIAAEDQCRDEFDGNQALELVYVKTGGHVSIKVIPTSKVILHLDLDLDETIYQRPELNPKPKAWGVSTDGDNRPTPIPDELAYDLMEA